MSREQSSTATGAREWSGVSCNVLRGCEHDCHYCYARAGALRYRRIRRLEEWARPELNGFGRRLRWTRAGTTVMFPTTHDISAAFLPVCRRAIAAILGAGDRLLIVSKPHVDCIAQICEDCRDRKDRVEFRFSIGALQDPILRSWEPGAPGIAERLACAELAQGAGFTVSVSIEPVLDWSALADMVMRFEQFANTIWIGTMNHLEAVRRCRENEIHAVREAQRVERLREVVLRFRKNPAVRWKDSIRKAVGEDLCAGRQ